MKKLILPIAALLLLASCANDAPNFPKSEKELPENSELIKSLTSFNDSLNSTLTPKGKGFWSFCKVALADIKTGYRAGKVGAKVGALIGPEGATAGAVVGGVVGAAAGSYCAYNTSRSDDPSDITSPKQALQAYAAVLEGNTGTLDARPKRSKVIIPIDDINVLRMGTNHNLVLQNLMENNLSLTPLEEILTPTELAVIESEEYQLTYYDAIQNFNLDVPSADLNDGSVDSYVMSLYLEILNSYPDKLEDIEFISNKYIEMIQASDCLSDDDKSLIYSAISIAAASYEYWNDKLNL